MPLVRISLREGTTPEYRRAIADGVHQAMIDAIAIPQKDRFQVVSEYKSGDLIYDADYLEVKRSDKIVFVQITLSTGRKPGQKRALFRRMAQFIGKVAWAAAGGPTCEFSRGELGELVVWEWRSAISERLDGKRLRGRHMSRPSCTNPLQVRVRARSDLAQAAVDVDFDAGDVGSVVGCEEGHGASDFFGCADAFHRNVRHKILQHGVSGFLGQTEASEDRSFDRAWRDGINTNVAGDQFRGECAGERSQRSFRCRIDGSQGVAFDSRDAGIQNDGAAIVEVRKSLLNRVVGAFGIDIEDFVVMGFVGVFE